MSQEIKRHSRLTTEGIGRAPNRGMLRAVGFLDEDFSRPMVGVASLFSDITPCNAHLDRFGPQSLRRNSSRRGRVPQIFGSSHCFGRHHDGPPGHALQPGVA